MRIACIGAGAIGGITAAFLQRAGQDVTLVCKHADIAALANGPGLHIEGVRTGDVCVPAVAEIAQLSGQYDACLIATKAYDLQDAARQVLPFLTPDALVVSMQNGICTDALAEVVGRARTVGCVIGWGATMLGPGRLDMTSEGEFILGLLDEADDARLRPLCEALGTLVPVQITHDILGELYSKLIVNACITSLGAVCGLTLGEMMQHRQVRDLFLTIIAEAMRVADALHIHVPPFGGKLDYYKLVKGTGKLDDIRRHTMIKIVGKKFSKLKSSSLQSLERGKPTEIDFFNGYIARRGAEAGVATPINARLTAMVKEIERKERPISFDNFQDPSLCVAGGRG